MTITTMNHIRPCLLLLALLCWTVGAFADPRAQNQGAQRYVKGLERQMRCPAAVEEKVQRASDKNELPPHLQLSDAARQQMTQTMFAESFKQLPAAMQQMLVTAPPEALAMQARSMGMTAEQMKHLISGGTVPAPKTSEFLTRRSAEITVASELGSSCDAQCMSNIRWSLIVAISGWKAVCATCSDDYLSVLTVDGQVWLDPRVSKWIRETPSLTPAQYPFKGKANSLHATVMPQSYGMAPKSRSELNKPTEIALMELVDAGDVSLRKVCSAPRAAPGETDVLQRVQAVLCGGDKGAFAASTAKLQLKLMAGPTSCGPSDAFLGCGKPDNSVELTFDKTRYTFVNVHGDKDAVVGPGNDPPLSGLAVLLHEIGHWFGLPHLNYRMNEIPDFMQDTYLENACVSGLNIMLMSGMSDERHAQRFRVGGGFKRGPAGRGTRTP
ncbi:hypothetical protein [Aquabacterium sp.]|uniref:hypothetical protein n=1 Tax=Aquabacterium sp. TaxID=1872578 RepID=UPI002D1A4B5B|nr:hypothetical protein [Aquabacterium sp.]HSW07310.1 hypothetical protein [Aquabacterium sp.]